MAFTILDAAGPVITVKVTGELSRSEVAQIQAASLDVIRRRDKVSALFILEDFKGWKRGDKRGDVSFLLAHDKDIARIAAVGDEAWRR